MPSPHPKSPLIGCTVTGCADLPAATVAAESFKRHHPGATFVTLLVDGDRSDAVIVPADLGIGPEELATLATSHTVREACRALRPRLMEWLLGKHDGPIVYLDPWVQVYAPLTPDLGDAALLLVPKVLRPLPPDGLLPDADQLRAAGVYDDGFVVAVHGAEHFLHAWAEAATRDPATAGAFLDSAPALVDHRVLRDPGLGLSSWNAAQRSLAKAPDGSLTSGGAPLRSVTFAGFDPTRPWLLNADLADRPRILLSEHPLLAKLCADYAAELSDAPTPTVRFGQLADGTTLPPALRAAFREAVDRPPAAGVDPAGFLRWACAPDPHAPRWAAALWQDDPDLRERFPDPFGADAEGYRDWCTTDGVLAGRIHPRAVAGQQDDEVALIDQIGVSVLGSGPLADRVRLAAGASGLPISDQPVYPVVLLCDAATTPPRQRHVIAVREQVGPLPRRADELWVAWPEVAPAPEGVVAHSIPLPTTDPGRRDDGAKDDARLRFGLGDGPVFVGLAEHGDDLVSAFSTAFPERADACLLVLVPASAARAEAVERLRSAAAKDRRVRLVGEPFSSAVDAADWAVSLHEPGCHDTPRVADWLTSTSLRGVPLITVSTGIGAELLGADGCVILRAKHLPVDTVVAGALRDLADDHATADKIGSAGRTSVLESTAAQVSGAAVRRRIELAYRNWRSGRAVTTVTDDDPLQALRAARHALLRKPDVDVGHRIPMAPQLRRAVLRVLNHYDQHLTSVLGSIIDSVERTAADLLRRQERLVKAGTGPEVDLVRADLDLVIERATQQARQVSATAEEVLRLRGEVDNGRGRVEKLAAKVNQAPKAVAADQLVAVTEALAASQARIDALEAKLTERLGERDTKVAMSTWSADQALRATDALRRVVVRQHERAIPAELADVPTSLVLCDAGMVRLPAQDAVMSAVLSSNGVWEPDVAELLDSLIEPDSVFVDIGAYVGYHAIRVLGRLGTSGTVVTVEPCPVAAKLLRHNVSENVSAAVAERMLVVQSAAWDTQVGLVGRPAPGGGLIVAPQDPQRVTTDTTDQVAVVGVRLDKELAANEATREQRLSVVKVDIPGRGHRALGGLVRRLRKDRPHIVLAMDGALTREYGGDPGIVLREFRTWGYELVRLGEERPVAVDDVVDEVLTGQVRTLWLRPVTGR